MADKAKDIMEAAGDAVQEAKEAVKDTEERAENASSKEEDKAEESKEAKAEEESEGKEGDSETEEDAESDEKKKEGSKLFKKKKDKKDEKIEELNDKYTRLFAEFDNFRKRSEKEKKAMFEVGAKSVIEKILPIIDSFERGLATIPEEEKTGFAEGMDKVYKQLITSLEEAGVKQIEAVGQEFDPNLHNAVMHIEDESLGENIIAEELQKGYIYRETVVRHSMVKVAN
ncbi:MAG: nucleotide exchange factor GrpE [Lachnospiraceae bacterium]|nr:nucleotide exchange factor GrpE [Lachnospiraceae bacterium]MCI9369223.1 nucleotide exchange factor GrpE [Lachnospiraceae bacterium]